MSVVTVTPYPSLGVAAREARSRAREARSRARAEKRQQSRPLRAIRRLFACFAIVFAMIGIGGGTAQAWPWDVGDQITAFITNFCGPEDVPVQNQVGGVDNVLDLNNPSSSELRGTILPNTGGAGAGGNWADRLTAAYGKNDTVAKPTYERYGFNTLRWTSYGSGCFSVAFWFNPISNFALNLFVNMPMIIGMAILKFALGNPLYTAFAAIISPFIQVFTAIFTPWVYFIAPIGVFWAWLRSKGSVQETLKAAVWVISIFGIFAWMGNNTSTVVTKANNFVTEFATSAASKITEVQGGAQVQYSTDDPTAGINQALWHGIPYQTWLLGEVGPDQAKADTAREASGEVGLGPAILNGLYVGNDDAGRDVILKTLNWNSLSYAPNGDDTKADAWTSGGGSDSWAAIPFLYNVKIICNDTEGGSSNSGEPENNKWMYGGSCDPAGAGTTTMVPYFQGKAYDAQLVTAFSGGFAAFAVVLAIIAASFYLAIQKMIFYFLLLFSPVFLAVSTFADPKRRRFATRYFEVLAANIIKQCVAVCGVLFIANAMGTLLYPPPELNLPDIPWMLKPVAAFLFFIALALFIFPLMSIVKAAAKGDTSIIDKTANAPANAAKLAGKAAIVGGAALATGGLGAGAAANALGGGKAASMLTSAGRLVGARGGVGKMLTTAGRGLHMRDSLSNALAQRQGTQAARQAGVSAMLQGKSGQAYLARMAKRPGMVGADGKLTKAGQAQAEKDFMKTVASGVTANRAAALQDAHMKQFFAGHRAQNNGQYHPLDPSSPENRQAAAVAAAQQRLAANEKANHERKRTDAQGNPVPNEPNQAKPTEGEVNQAARQQSQAAFASASREKVDGPAFARDANIKPAVTATSAEVLSEAGISRAEAAANPTLLLTGKAYSGGDTATMNPLHPATAAMSELRFAMANGSEQDIQAAAAKASEAIVASGVPEQVSKVTATGTTAAQFQTADVVGPMPNITASTTWQERAEAAATMQAAAATIPADNPAGQVVRDYVSALSNPAVSAGDVEALKVQAIKALDDNVMAENGAVQESLFNPTANPAAEGMGATGRFVASAPVQTGDATAPAMAAAGGAAVATAERPMEVNGVPLTANAPLSQIDRAVETLEDGHPARASYAQYVQALENTDATDQQVESARQAVMSDLSAVATPMTNASQPALFDVPSAEGAATVAAAAVPDGFRETSVPTQDGGTVRGIEPAAGWTPSTPAPEGYAAQTVTAQDGSTPVAGASVTGDVDNTVDDGPSFAADASRAQATQPASYEQPALFDVPAQGSDDQFYAGSAQAPTQTGYASSDVSPAGAEVSEDDHRDAYIAGAAGIATGAALSGDTYREESVSSEREEPTTSYQESAGSYDQPAMFDMPSRSDAPVAATVDMDSSRDDIARAVETLPEGHAARESFAAYEAAQDGPSFAAEAPVDDLRQTVLNDLGVNENSGPVSFTEAPEAGFVGVGGVQREQADEYRDGGFSSDTYTDAPAAGYVGESAQSVEAPSPSYAPTSAGAEDSGYDDHTASTQDAYTASASQEGAQQYADVPEAGYVGMAATSGSYNESQGSDQPFRETSYGDSSEAARHEGYDADSPFAQGMATDVPEAGYVGIGASSGSPTTEHYDQGGYGQSDDSGWSADSGHSDRGGDTYVVSAPQIDTADQPESDQSGHDEPISEGPSFDPGVGNSDYYVPSNDHGYGRNDGPSFAAPEEQQQDVYAANAGWRDEVAPAGYVGIQADDDYGPGHGSGDEYREPPTVVVNQGDGYQDEYRDYDDQPGRHDGPMSAVIDRDSLRDAMRELHDEQERMRPVDAPAPFEVGSYDESPRYADQGGQTYSENDGYSPERVYTDQGGYADYGQQEFTAPQETTQQARFERPEVAAPVAPSAPDEAAPVEEESKPISQPNESDVVQEFRRSKKRRNSGLYDTDDEDGDNADENERG
jgi:hypothetical protein